MPDALFRYGRMTWGAQSVGPGAFSCRSRVTAKIFCRSFFPRYDRQTVLAIIGDRHPFFLPSATSSSRRNTNRAGPATPSRIDLPQYSRLAQAAKDPACSGRRRVGSFHELDGRKDRTLEDRVEDSNRIPRVGDLQDTVLHLFVEPENRLGLHQVVLGLSANGVKEELAPTAPVVVARYGSQTFVVCFPVGFEIGADVEGPAGESARAAT